MQAAAPAVKRSRCQIRGYRCACTGAAGARRDAAATRRRSSRHRLRCADRHDGSHPLRQREEMREIVSEIIQIKNVVISIADEELLEHICKDVLGCGRLDRDGAVLTSCRQERLHALPRQFIGAFIFDVAGVAAHPVPLNLVALPCGVEPLP